MIGLLRLSGVPCRHVNGYVYVPDRNGAPSESHAWVEFFSREHGWVGFDPTHLDSPGDAHVVVATARHYDEVPPNKCVYRGTAKEVLTAEVHIEPIEAPAFSTFREEIREIELPVYSEIPSRRLLGAPEDQDDQTNQQRQQQQ